MPGNHSGTTTVDGDLFLALNLYYPIRQEGHKICDAVNENRSAAIPQERPIIGVSGMAAAQPSSSRSLAPPLRCRLVFDRRYGWIFDEWTDPADQSLSGGRRMFCAVTMARSLVTAAASSISYASCSVGRVLQSPKSLSLPAYIPSLAFNKKHQAWLRELENSAVIADLKLLNCSTHFALECMTTDCLCLTRQHDLLQSLAIIQLQ
ncbi:uncharacterized protein LOC120665846 isoform X6 [Panicum virgatum]|uniref:uncharacterized protein LOC120665846 isoform X6 n=1 Tax=Panicum virgatum TaxID=38727 RepID=UPI0019D52C66|nr:uncharacterized protein LOC120665846 isoform X6 [Panicum virgatum]